MLSPSMEYRKSRLNYLLLLCVVFGGFFVFGMSENIKGPAIPHIQADFRLTEGQLGWLLALNALGYLLACSFTSALANKIGIKLTGIVAFTSMALAGVLMYVSVAYPFFMASYFLMYLGNGMLEIGLGIMAARIFTRNTGTMMNLSHFFYGLSSMVAPLAAANLMGWTVFGGELGWRGMYLVVLSGSLLPVIPSILGKFPGKQEAGANGGSIRPLAAIAREPMAWLIVAVLSFGVVSEMAIGSWLVYFLEKAYGWTNQQAAQMLSVFFLCFTLARLVIGPVTDKLGYTLSVALLSAFSGICTLAGLWLGEGAAVLLAVAGFGIAPIYPTVMALLAKRYGDGVDAAITFTVTLMGIGSVIGHFAVGYIMEWLGLRAGYGFIGVLALLCAVCSFLMLYRMRRRQEAY